jgi:hypothetical protein
MLSESDGAFLLKLARAAVENYVRDGRTISPPESYPPALATARGIFVTICRRSPPEVCGCVGLPYPSKPLVEGVIEAAIGAVKDLRFPSLSTEDLPNLRIQISILTEPEQIRVKDPLDYPKVIKPDEGLIIRRGILGGLFLPVVWKQFPKPRDFLTQLCFKAGLMADSWATDPAVRIYKFKAQSFEEK